MSETETDRRDESMNWTRKEVKERAKAALKRNYWKAVFVSFIFILLSNGASSPSASSIVNNGKEKTEEIFIIQMDEAEEIVDSARFVEEWGGEFITCIPEVRIFHGKS